MGDFWDPTRPDSFDVTKLYTASKDQNKESGQPQLRVPQTMIDFANDFAMSRKIPQIRRGNDVWRAGGVGFLNWGVNHYTPELEPRWSDIVQKEEADARAQARQATIDLVHALDHGLMDSRRGTPQQFAIEMEAAREALLRQTDPDIRARLQEIISRY